MPDFILHRVNTLQQLKEMKDLSLGCEIDLRSDVATPGALHLSHDPWKKGEDFEPWLKEFKQRGFRGTLILNTKEDGLEARVFELLEKYDVKNYFFLDTALPTLVKWSIKNGRSSFAMRLSAFEPLSFVAKFSGRVDWIWIDCFDLMPLAMVADLRERVKAKLCLVSPELQGGSEEDYKRFNDWASVVDAICTKKPEAWRARLAK